MKTPEAGSGSTKQIPSTTSDNERPPAFASLPSLAHDDVKEVQGQPERNNDTPSTQDVPQRVPSTSVANKNLGKRFDDEIDQPSPQTADKPQSKGSGSTSYGWHRYAQDRANMLQKPTTRSGLISASILQTGAMLPSPFDKIRGIRGTLSNFSPMTISDSSVLGISTSDTGNTPYSALPSIATRNMEHSPDLSEHTSDSSRNAAIVDFTQENDTLPLFGIPDPDFGQGTIDELIRADNQVLVETVQEIDQENEPSKTSATLGAKDYSVKTTPRQAAQTK